MPSLDSGVEKSSGKSKDENLDGFELAFKLRKAITNKVRANGNPNYQGDNPKTTKEVIKDLSAMGKVSTSESSATNQVEGVKKVEIVQDQILPPAKELEVAVEDSAETKASQVVIGEESKPVIEKPELAVSTAKPRVEKGERTSFDRQIYRMRKKLEEFNSSSKKFDETATPDQKENRAKITEALNRGIADAENRKAEWLAQKLVKKAKTVKLQEAKAPVGASKQGEAEQEVVPDQSLAVGQKWQTGTGKSGILIEGINKDSGEFEITKSSKGKASEWRSIDGEKLKKMILRGGYSLSTEKDSSIAAPEDTTRDEEAESKKQKTVVLSEPPEVSPIVEPKVEAPVEEPQVEAKQEAEQLNLNLKTSPTEKWGVSGEKAKRGPNGERETEQGKKEQKEEKTIEEKIVEARERVENTRKEYVKEDYENTNRWTKIKNFFRHIKQEKGPDYEYYQAQYQNALIDLRNAELAKIRNSGLQGKDLNEALAGTLRYFKYDELVNVVNERTQVRAEHQGWSGKVMGMMEGIGRSYNKLSFKQKMFTAGTMWGLAGMTGGTSLLARRILAGLGTGVALEATMGKISDKLQSKKAQKEAEQQIEILKQRAQNPEYSLKDNGRYMEEIFDKDILSLDGKLQKQKRDALFRKAAAFGIGLGSSYFFREIFQMIHGNEAVDWMKEHISGTAPVSENVPLSEGPKVSSVLPEAADVKTDLIKDFVNQDIVVEKGDSVWKISERLADNLGLDGAERTHFVDALKDKFGDVQLQAGEHINFSEHGINEDFVKHAFEDSNAISPEQSAQILENNTRLGAFAEANPNVRLTDEVTKNILEGKTGIAAEQAANEFRFGQQVDLEHQPVPEGASPEDIASEYGARADGWYDQIFKVENVQPGDRILGRDVVESLKIRDVLHDANLFRQGAEGGYTTGLSRQEIANFAKFDMNVSNGKSILFDRAGFFRNNPNATVLDYLKKIASLTRRGQRIGSFTTL